jgi:Uncharacterized protein conserved in bacteria (DUF2252)
LSKLGELVGGQYRIVSQPPIVVPARELEATYGLSREEIEAGVREQFRAYRATLRDDQRQLLERFELLDMARKVVGVGSVGTRAFIVLLQGRDQHDPLFLQVKEATRSVLEGPLPKSHYQQHGERVVYGQRMMQAASDIYLGWSTGTRAHARSGDPIAIAAYLGESDQFDRSIADFSQRYADQNERDYRAFANAVRSGRLQALEGV